MSEENVTGAEATPQTDTASESTEAKAEKKGWKKGLFFFLKLAFSVGMLWVIFRKVLKREGAEDLGERLADLSWGWIAAAIAMQLIAIGFATLRWRTLLSGQGIRPSWRFLGGSIFIARFWGAFTPGGFTGFGGWRIFDFLRVDDQLFATDVFPGPGLQRWLDAEQRQHWHAPVYELAAAASGDRPRFRRRLDLDAATLFPDTPQAGQRAAVVERALAWGKTAAYLGVFAAWQDRWPARGAYLAERLREGDVRVHRIPLPARALAFDLRLEGDALQLLFAAPEDDGRWRNSLWSSRDGRRWEALLSFCASGPARAVERLGDHLYFGLGSPRPPEAGVCTRTDALSGTLIRWRAL